MKDDTNCTKKVQTVEKVWTVNKKVWTVNKKVWMVHKKVHSANKKVPIE